MGLVATSNMVRRVKNPRLYCLYDLVDENNLLQDVQSLVVWTSCLLILSKMSSLKLHREAPKTVYYCGYCESCLNWLDTYWFSRRYNRYILFHSKQLRHQPWETFYFIDTFSTFLDALRNYYSFYSKIDYCNGICYLFYSFLQVIQYVRYVTLYLGQTKMINLQIHLQHSKDIAGEPKPLFGLEARITFQVHDLVRRYFKKLQTLITHLLLFLSLIFEFTTDCWPWKQEDAFTMTS